MGILDKKVVIITGSSSGIGWGTAKELWSEGAYIVLHGQNEQALAERGGELKERVTWIAADLSDKNAPQKIIEHAVNQFERLDGLVNNAGIFPRDDISRLSHALYEKIFAINTRAPLFLCHEAVKIFRKQSSGGSIVNIGSINAHCGQGDILSYSMSKGALQTMTRNLGDALGPEGIRINQLNVGWTFTETEHAVQMGTGQPENWLEKVPLAFAPSGTLLRPENIAPHVAFWLSEKSSPVNGQVYEVEQFPMIGRNKIAER